MDTEGEEKSRMKEGEREEYRQTGTMTNDLLRALEESRQHGRQDGEVGHDSCGNEGVIWDLGGRL